MRMFINRSGLALLLLSTSLSASASWLWAKSTPAAPINIKNTAFYYDDASNQVVVEIELDRAISVTCTGASSATRLAFWTAAPESMSHALRQSAALAAQTNGAAVDVRYRSNSCYTHDGSVMPRFDGIRVLQ